MDFADQCDQTVVWYWGACLSLIFEIRDFLGSFIILSTF